MIPYLLSEILRPRLGLWPSLSPGVRFQIAFMIRMTQDWNIYLSLDLQLQNFQLPMNWDELKIMWGTARATEFDNLRLCNGNLS